MIPYLLMFAFPGALALTGARRSIVVLLLVALTYWLMVGFRFHVGMDWNNYLRIYQANKHIPATELLFRREPGFGLLNWLADKLGGGLIFVNAFSALVFCWGFFAVAKTCREPFIAVVVGTPLLVVGFAMSGTRQSIAMGVIFFLYATWQRRGIWSRVALVLLATLFHFSAVFVLIFVALSAQVPLVAKLAGAAAIGLIILLIIYFAPSSMGAYSDMYISGPRRITAPGAIAQIGVLAVPALVYFLYRKTWLQVNGDNPLYYNLAIAALVAVPVITVSSVGAYRFALYFWPMAMYVWAGVPAMINSPSGRALYRVLIVSASGALLVGWLIFATNSPAWLPYQNWLLQPEGASLLRHRFMG
jgi:hypothetical protein